MGVMKGVRTINLLIIKIKQKLARGRKQDRLDLTNTQLQLITFKIAKQLHKISLMIVI